RCAHAQKKVLERHHAGVGEQQGRVALGDERERGHDLVTALLEEVEERLADVDGGPAHAAFYLTRRPARDPTAELEILALSQPPAAAVRLFPRPFSSSIALFTIPKNSPIPRSAS